MPRQTRKSSASSARGRSSGGRGRKKYPDPVGNLHMWKGTGGKRPVLVGYANLNEETYEIAIWKRDGKLSGRLMKGHQQSDNQESYYWVNVQKNQRGKLYGYINGMEESDTDDESYVFNMNADGDLGGYWATIAPAEANTSSSKKSKAGGSKRKRQDDDEFDDEDDDLLDDEELEDDEDDDTEWVPGGDDDDEDEDEDDDEDSDDDEEEEEDDEPDENPRAKRQTRTPPAKPSARRNAAPAARRKR